MSESTMPEPTAYDRAAVLGERLKERIYASLTLLAVLVGLAQGGHATHKGATVAVTATALGLWLATLVADMQAHPVVHGRRSTRHEIRHELFTSSPLLTSAIGPLLLIGVSALGAVDLTTALWIAAGSEVLTLALWGFVGGRRAGVGPLHAVVTSALNAAIGLSVVFVKLLAGH
ncbi:hypothetical protein ACIRL3_15580 [Streptomyces sp. NPDC102384]|uniref:hypothetical protein n=1 Tax=Streptomyces sp. NPDC102384 TaxID=3366166 RepID=UPI003807E33C